MEVDFKKYRKYIEIVDLGYWRIKKGTPKKIADEIRSLFKQVKEQEKNI